MVEQEWHGEERRGIPIHILNYMDERLKAHVDHVENIFKFHTEEEMKRYGDILKMIGESRKAAEGRHAEIMELMSGFTYKCKSVTDAFLKAPDGTPDFDGHRYDHDKRKRFADWWESVKDKAITKVVEWGALAFVVWVVHTLWESLLKGPGK
jgi:hypothetical protein